MTSHSSAWHPSNTGGLSSSFCSSAQNRIQYIPLNSTCRDEETRAQLKVMSFRVSQIAHKMAHAPTKAWCLRNFLNPFNQWVNIWATFNGIGKLKTTLISLHKNLAFWQSKKRCCIVSLRLQQQHFKLPFRRSLAKLSLVRVTPFIKYHIKILILSDNFSFQIMWLCGIILVAVIALYMDRTENSPFCCRDHTKLSL